MILRMFKWIVCSRQPLHVDELREGIAFTLEDEEWRQEKIPTNLNRLIRACSNLVIVDAETNVVQLAHYTVQQYLLKDDGRFFQFGLKDANEMAGEFCLTYLTFSCFDTQVTRYGSNTNTDMVALQKMASSATFVASDHPGRRIIQAWNFMRGPRTASGNVNLMNLTTRSKLKADSISAFRFLGYVVVHWLWHTIDFETSPHSSRRDRMFRDLVCWKDLLFDFRPWASFNRATQISSSIALIGWAWMANHRYLLEMVSIEIDHFNPSQLASSGWLDFILNSGALTIHDSDVDSLNILQKEPCYSKSAMGNTKWLLSQLLFACQKGHHHALGAVDLNSVSEDSKSVAWGLPQFLIHFTAGTGHLETIKYLTTKKQVGEEMLRSMWVPESWRSTLERAFASRHFDTVLYLSSVGYKIEQETYLRFLINAIATGDHESAECLLNPELTLRFKIDPQELSDVFVLSVQQGFHFAVARMLQLGVNPNVLDRQNQVPIVEAIRSRNQEMVALLLQYGCCLEMTRYWLPLTIAAAMGDLAICEMLIAAGAEVFHGSYKDEHAVALIAVFETNQTSQRQLELSLSPTPLYMACSYGHWDIVRILLESGAATNFPSPTHYVDALPAPANVGVGFTCHAYTIEPDGSVSKDSAVRSDTIAQWKYPVAVAIEQGHDDIISLLSRSSYSSMLVSRGMTVSSLDIGSTQQCAIQKVMLHNLALKLSTPNQEYKDFVVTAIDYTDTSLSKKLKLN
ncbi:ankyrin [Cadophora sp. DSE1049]|nr:ankyrin [Cadophora sp. DSE1049]